MSDKKSVPSDAPPSYNDATASSSSASHLQVSDTKGSGISTAARRSLEDAHRPLPKGWVRTIDPESHHHFYVDTTKDPPRSVWVHPYDDPEYLGTLSSEERERIEEESLHRGQKPSNADIMASHTDESGDEEYGHPQTAELPPRPDGIKNKGKGRSFGRRVKDKLTGSTHEEREAERTRRAEQERKLYEQNQKFRAAMARAAQTGKPELVGKDANGKDVYVEPPLQAGPAGYGYSASSYGYDPYSSGYYAAPNSRYGRPTGPYGRPYGGGFGGGYGLPLALGGGLLGGLLIGDALGGGFF